jgi:hypothetical protein
LKVFFSHIVLLLILLMAQRPAAAQYKVRGTVLDSSRNYPLQSVSVLTTSGRGTVTDGDGQYTIDVNEKDSIWFSYLGKPTVKFPVLKIQDSQQFDISLKVSIPVLPEVKVRPRNYRLDSIQNRIDYQKVFNFKKPNLESMTSIGPSGAGIDINELIRTFQFRKNRSTLAFRERLILQEQEKFIDHRFSPALIRRLTGLEGEPLKAFIVRYRPSYEFALFTSEYDFQLYIKTSAEKFRKSKSF